MLSFKAIELKDFSVDFLVYRLSSIFLRKKEKGNLSQRREGSRAYLHPPPLPRPSRYGIIHLVGGTKLLRPYSPNFVQPYLVEDTFKSFRLLV